MRCRSWRNPHLQHRGSKLPAPRSLQLLHLLHHSKAQPAQQAAQLLGASKVTCPRQRACRIRLTAGFRRLKRWDAMGAAGVLQKDT